MSPNALLRRAKRRPLTSALAVALVAGVTVHIIGLAAVGAKWTFPPPPPAPTPYVRAVSSDSALNERAALLDPSPLFLPSQKKDAVTTPGPILKPDEPPLGAPGRKIAVTESVIKAFVKESATPTVAGKSPEELVSRSNRDDFLMLGRVKPDAKAISANKTTLILRDETTGTRVGLRKTEFKAPERTENTLESPAEFFVEIDSYGAAAPVLKKSSGDQTADLEYAKVIRDSLLTTPMPHGRYLIVVTP